MPFFNRITNTSLHKWSIKHRPGTQRPTGRAGSPSQRTQKCPLRLCCRFPYALFLWSSASRNTHWPVKKALVHAAPAGAEPKPPSGSLLLYFLPALPLGILGGVGLSSLLFSVIERHTEVSYLRWFSACVLLPVLLSGAPSIFCILKISPMEKFIKSEPYPQAKREKKTAVSRPVITARLGRTEPSPFSKTWVSVALATVFLLFFNHFSIYYEPEDTQEKSVSDDDFPFTNNPPAREVVNADGTDDCSHSPPAGLRLLLEQFQCPRLPGESAQGHKRAGGHREDQSA